MAIHQGFVIRQLQTIIGNDRSKLIVIVQMKKGTENQKSGIITAPEASFLVPEDRTGLEMKHMFIMYSESVSASTKLMINMARENFRMPLHMEGAFRRDLTRSVLAGLKKAIDDSRYSFKVEEELP